MTANVKDAAGNDSTDYAAIAIEQGDDNDYTDVKYKNPAALAKLGPKATGFKVDTVGDGVDGAGAKKVTETFSAYGAKAATNYPIKVTLTKNDGKTVERTVNITVKALPDDAYDFTKTGVKVTYGLEVKSHTLDSGDVDKDTTTARLTATVNGTFAGYVRNAADGIETTIGTQLEGGVAEAGVGYIEAPAADGYVSLTEKTGSSDTWVFTASNVNASAGTAGAELGADYAWTATDDAALIDFEAGATTSYEANTLLTVGTYYTETDTSTAANNEFVIADATNKKYVVAAPSGMQMGNSMTAAVPGSGYTWVATNDEDLADFVDGDTPSYTRASVEGGSDSDYYYTLNPGDSSVAPNEFVLVQTGKKIRATAPTAEELGSAPVPASVNVNPVAKTVAIDWLGTENKDGLMTILNVTDVTDIFNLDDMTDLPDDVTIEDGSIGTYTPGTSELDANKWLNVAADSRIYSVALGVKFGSLYADTATDPTVAELYDVAATNVAPTPEANSENELTINTFDGSETPAWVVGDEAKSPNFARSGSYTVFFNYVNSKGEDKQGTNPLTVTNSFKAPVVTVTDRVVSSLDSDSIKEKLVANVDLNNDEGANVSIVTADLSGKTNDPKTGFLFNQAEAGTNKMTVKYV